jgi:hypothetical protein
VGTGGDDASSHEHGVLLFVRDVKGTITNTTTISVIRGSAGDVSATYTLSLHTFSFPSSSHVNQFL